MVSFEFGWPSLVPVVPWMSTPWRVRLSTVTVTGADVWVDPSPRVITAVMT